MSLNGQVALVTGGSGSIGRVICRQLAERGASVWVHCHRRRQAAQEVVAGLPTPPDGGRHGLITADLCDAEAVRSAVAQVVTEAGRLDLLVNNAGVYRRLALQEASYDAWCAQWEKTLAINLVAPANVSYCAAQHMMLQRNGKIINISSRGAFRGEPQNPAYGASKSGLNALTQSLAVALAPHGISVFAVAPGFVESALDRDYMTTELAAELKGQSPLGRLATPADVAYWVGCLAEEAAAFATGTIVDVNGASHLRT